MTALRRSVSPALLSVLALATLSACASTTSVERSPEARAYGAFLVGVYAKGVDDPETAQRYLAAAQSLAPDSPVVARNSFSAAVAAGDLDAAAALAPQVVASDPANDLARLVAGAHAIKTQRYDVARRYLDFGDEQTFNALVARLLFAWAVTGEEGPRAGLAILDDGPNDVVFSNLALLTRAALMDQASDPGARAAFEAAFLASRPRGVAFGALGQHLERSGNDGDARAYYTAALELNPLDPTATAGLARLDAGEEAGPFAATPAEGAAYAFFAPALTYADHNQLAPAIINLRIALHLDPENDALRYQLGRTLSQGGDDAAARLELAKVSDASPYALDADIAEAFAYVRDDAQVDPALKTLERAIARTGAARATFAKADVLRGAERYADAFGLYDAMVADLDDAALETSDWRLFYARGVTSERLGKWTEAEADFRQALELSPNQPSVLNYLGYSLVDRGEKLDEAFALIRRAVAARPDAGHIVDSLGWAHFRLGEYDEAVRHLERAAALSPSDPTINDHLGDAYWRVGRQLEAAYQWRRALTLDPEPEMAQTIQIKLDEGLPPRQSTPVSDFEAFAPSDVDPFTLDASIGEAANPPSPRAAQPAFAPANPPIEVLPDDELLGGAPAAQP